MTAMIALSTHAMATRFELVLHGDDEIRLRAAGEEALQEIERIEAQLSLYRPDSEVSWINRRAATEPVKVEPRLFQMLARCAELNEATEGAFDITVGPLMRAWHFVGDTGALPSAGEIDSARALTGMSLVELDHETYEVRFQRAGVELDFGAYAKGYAIERAIELLIDHGVGSALLHGGTSSTAVIGRPPDHPAWRIQLSEPFKTGDHFITIDLRGRALSVSAIHGKAFLADGETFGHVIDPRDGRPVSRARAAAVTGPSAAICEALSTALLVLGPSWLERMNQRFAGYAGTIAYGDAAGGVAIARLGL